MESSLRQEEIFRRSFTMFSSLFLYVNLLILHCWWSPFFYAKDFFDQRKPLQHNQIKNTIHVVIIDFEQDIQCSCKLSETRSTKFLLHYLCWIMYVLYLLPPSCLVVTPMVRWHNKLTTKKEEKLLVWTNLLGLCIIVGPFTISLSVQVTHT
jgi:hypothetical protein